MSILVSCSFEALQNAPRSAEKSNFPEDYMLATRKERLWRSCNARKSRKYVTLGLLWTSWSEICCLSCYFLWQIMWTWVARQPWTSLCLPKIAGLKAEIQEMSWKNCHLASKDLRWWVSYHGNIECMLSSWFQLSAVSSSHQKSTSGWMSWMHHSLRL